MKKILGILILFLVVTCFVIAGGKQETDEMDKTTANPSENNASVTMPVVNIKKNYENISYDIMIENPEDVQIYYSDLETGTMAARIEVKENGEELFYIQYNDSLFGPYWYIDFTPHFKKVTDDLFYFITVNEDHNKTIVMTDGRTYPCYKETYGIRFSEDGKKIIFAYQKDDETDNWYIFANNKHYGPYELTWSQKYSFLRFYIDSKKTVFNNVIDGILYININGVDYSGELMKQNVLGYYIYKMGKLPGFSGENEMWHLVVESDNLHINRPVGFTLNSRSGFKERVQFDKRFILGDFGYAFIQYYNEDEYVYINWKKFGPFDKIGQLGSRDGKVYFPYEKTGSWYLWVDGDSLKFPDQPRLDIWGDNDEKYITDRHNIAGPTVLSYTTDLKVISYPVAGGKILQINGEQIGSYPQLLYYESKDYPGQFCYIYSKTSGGSSYININNVTYGPYTEISNLIFNGANSWAFQVNTHDPTSDNNQDNGNEYIITNKGNYGPYNKLTLERYTDNDLIFRHNIGHGDISYNVETHNDKTYAYSSFNRYIPGVGNIFETRYHYDDLDDTNYFESPHMQINEQLYNIGFDTSKFWDNKFYHARLSNDGKSMIFKILDLNQQNENENLLIAHAQMIQDRFSKIRSIIYSFNSLIESGYDIDTEDNNGATSLMWAAFRGNLELVKYLVEHDAELYPKGIIWLNDEKTGFIGGVLHAAVHEGHMDIVKYLVEDVNLDINKGEYDNSTGKFSDVSPIYFAVDYGNINMIKYLINHGAELDKTVISNGEAMTILDYSLFAQSSRNEDLLFYFIDHGIKYNMDKNTAVLNSSWKKFFKISEYLIKTDGADLNAAWDSGFSLLHIAVYYNSFDFLKFLVDAGADVNIECTFDDGQSLTPLQYAEINQEETDGVLDEIIEYLRGKETGKD